MASIKTMQAKMADEGLRSFIVTFRPEGDDETQTMQFWAEDAGHAGEQMDDAEPGCEVVLVETQDEYETRTGETLDCGRREDL